MPSISNPVGANNFGPAAGLDSYTTARIDAYFNVTQQDFDQTQYLNGQTSELAGRGLYGDYKLLIPAGEIATEPGQGGLDLDQINDILLRFDYVSVAAPQ